MFVCLFVCLFVCFVVLFALFCLAATANHQAAEPKTNTGSDITRLMQPIIRLSQPCASHYHQSALMFCRYYVFKLFWFCLSSPSKMTLKQETIAACFARFADTQIDEDASPPADTAREASPIPQRVIKRLLKRSLSTMSGVTDLDEDEPPPGSWSAPPTPPTSQSSCPATPAVSYTHLTLPTILRV